MLKIIQIEDQVKVFPYHFGKEEQAVRLEIEKKYVNQVLKGAGLVVSLYDIQKVESMVVHLNDEGCAYASVTFRLVVFHPSEGQILEGLLYDVTPLGLRISVGFFNDIWVLPESLKYPHSYDESTNTFSWCFENHPLPYVKHRRIRVKVDKVTWNDQPSARPDLETENPFSKKKMDAIIPTYPQFCPMTVNANTVADGLGMVDWWIGNTEKEPLTLENDE